MIDMRRTLLAMLLCGAVAGIGAPAAGAQEHGATVAPSSGVAPRVEIGTAVQITRGDAQATEPAGVQVLAPTKIAAVRSAGEGALSPTVMALFVLLMGLGALAFGVRFGAPNRERAVQPALRIPRRV